MKAAVRYRCTESIRIEELPRPVPKPNELLVRVRATTVNRTDCAILTGKPAIMKLMLGWPKPRVPVTGTDFAGVVEEAGERVTRLQDRRSRVGFRRRRIAPRTQTFSRSPNIAPSTGSPREFHSKKPPPAWKERTMRITSSRK